MLSDEWVCNVLRHMLNIYLMSLYSLIFPYGTFLQFPTLDKCWACDATHCRLIHHSCDLNGSIMDLQNSRGSVEVFEYCSSNIPMFIISFVTWLLLYLAIDLSGIHVASETLSLLLECVLFTKWVVGGWETRQNDGSRIVFMNKAEWKAEWHCSEETNVKLVSIKRITNRSQES